tara:strand:+ start:63 stop:479 length:417 start_codon:yes stop_codon:yes gene_type:complete
MSFSLKKNYDQEMQDLNEKTVSNSKGLAEIKNTTNKVILDPKYIYIIGIIAGLLTSIAFAPQVINSYKNKEKTTITWLTLILASFGQILWLTYGTLSHVDVIKIFATITLIMYLLLILSKFIFKNKLIVDSVGLLPNY